MVFPWVYLNILSMNTTWLNCIVLPYKCRVMIIVQNMIQLSVIMCLLNRMTGGGREFSSLISGSYWFLAVRFSVIIITNPSHIALFCIHFPPCFLLWHHHSLTFHSFFPFSMTLRDFTHCLVSVPLLLLDLITHILYFIFL